MRLRIGAFCQSRRENDPNAAQIWSVLPKEKRERSEYGSDSERFAKGEERTIRMRLRIGAFCQRRRENDPNEAQIRSVLPKLKRERSECRSESERFAKAEERTIRMRLRFGAFCQS
ncbi:hypothetical protein ACM26V_11810 [Salipaludibacillus sp. HK11]|uniref:hypothetical protein n=1 Tax=Salipaludibacillus sp. HK11 TaxID=3394320 RepID=UPI0039FC726D